jgi:glutathione peroxidase
MKLLTIVAAFFLWQTSIYTISVPSIDGGTINFNNYQNKKILLVNIATGSQLADQINDLETFYQQHKDSVVVVAFPSNSFGNESGDNAEIRQLLQNTYHVHFPVAGLSAVNGDNANTVYQWLQKQELNGSMNGVIKKDFQKFLINESGILVGVFASSVKLNSQEFLSSIFQ